MDNSWEKYEPSPIEFMHGMLMNEFHKWRKERTNEITILIDGNEFNKIVVAAKLATYKKYKTLGLDKAILKSELWESSKVKCDLCNREWIAVRPEGIDRLECPNCHNIASFENINNE